MPWQPANQSYHPPPPRPPDCRQCGQGLAIRGGALVCGTCGLPHEGDLAAPAGAAAAPARPKRRRE